MKIHLTQAALLSLAALLAADAHSAPITILNDSFEAPVLATGVNNLGDGTATNWTSPGAGIGRLSHFTPGAPGVLGDQFGFANDLASQTLTDTFTANTDYTFNGYVFTRDGQDVRFSIGYNSGGYQELSGVTIDVSELGGGWVQIAGTTHSTVGTGAELGENIIVQLQVQSGSGGAWFDAVALNAVPEPGSLALLGLGGLLVARRRRA